MGVEDLLSPQGARARIAEVELARPFAWVARGWADFRAAPLASAFYGAAFAAMGWALLALFDFAHQYVPTLACAFLLAGPFLATGLYALSRDRELGRRPAFARSLLAWRENPGALGIYVLVLTVIVLVWARASLVVFALFHTGSMPDLRGFLGQAFSLANLEFVLAWFAAGSVFAAIVFAASVVSVPMMLDRRNDAVSAALLSAACLARNLPAMLLWAAIIVAFTAAGLATAFVGLVLTMPVIGHATWHAYRDCIGWSDDPAAAGAP